MSDKDKCYQVAASLYGDPMTYDEALELARSAIKPTGGGYNTVWIVNVVARVEQYVAQRVQLMEVADGTDETSPA